MARESIAEAIKAEDIGIIDDIPRIGVGPPSDDRAINLDDLLKDLKVLELLEGDAN